MTVIVMSVNYISSSVTNVRKYPLSYPHNVNISEIRVIIRNLATLIAGLDLKKNQCGRLLLPDVCWPVLFIILSMMSKIFTRGHGS